MRVQITSSTFPRKARNLDPDEEIEEVRPATGQR